MANYVVDASVVIEYLITGPNTRLTERFFSQITDKDILIVPEFCLLECTNVLWKQVRFNNMSRDTASDLLKVLRNLKLRRTPMKQLLDRSLEIALKHKLAVYDSGYIALAAHYHYQLVSIDKRQVDAALMEHIGLITFSTY